MCPIHMASKSSGEQDSNLDLGPRSSHLTVECVFV